MNKYKYSNFLKDVKEGKEGERQDTQNKWRLGSKFFNEQHIAHWFFAY